jgi:hypothetical protein
MKWRPTPGAEPSTAAWALADSDSDTGTDGRAKAPGGPAQHSRCLPVCRTTRPPAQSSRLCGYPATDQPDMRASHDKRHRCRSRAIKAVI